MTRSFQASHRRWRPMAERSSGPAAEPTVVTGPRIFSRVLGALAAIRAWVPERTPDVGRLVRGDIAYLRQEYVLIVAWAIGTLLLASLVGLLVGAFGPLLAKPFHRFIRIKQQSAWHLMLQGQPDREVYCGCALDDGSWLGGYLYSTSTTTQEIADRDLVLTGELTYRPKGMDAVTLDEQAAIVSARNIRFLTVTYLERGEVSAPKSSSEEAATSLAKA
jgi:hypothetical protein